MPLVGLLVFCLQWYRFEVSCLLVGFIHLKIVSATSVLLSDIEVRFFMTAFRALMTGVQLCGDEWFTVLCVCLM